MEYEQYWLQSLPVVAVIAVVIAVVVAVGIAENVEKEKADSFENVNEQQVVEKEDQQKQVQLEQFEKILFPPFFYVNVEYRHHLSLH